MYWNKIFNDLEGKNALDKNGKFLPLLSYSLFIVDYGPLLAQYFLEYNVDNF